MPTSMPSTKPPTVALLLLLTLSLAHPAAATKSCGDPDAEDTRDGVLPPGFQGVSWGMSGEVVQAVRGLPMERQADLYNDRVYSLREDLGDEGTTTVVVYTFFDDRLWQVTRYLDPGLLQTAESTLLARFNDEFGAPLDRRTVRDHTGSRGGDPQTHPIVEKAWIWCDRFTEMVLFRRLEAGELMMRSTSRFYRKTVREASEQERDRGQWERLQGLFPE